MIKTVKSLFTKTGIILQSEDIQKICYYFHQEHKRLYKKHAKNDILDVNTNNNIKKDQINFNTISNKLGWFEQNAKSRCQLIIQSIINDINYQTRTGNLAFNVTKYRNSKYNLSKWENNNVKINEINIINNIINKKKYVNLNEEDYKILDEGTKKIFLDKTPKIWHKYHDSLKNKILKNKLIWFYGLEQRNLPNKLVEKLYK